jgi:predicted 3-demethylubiquinone-9 3-methyltransferase (glyoxalase superfamily)
VRQGSAPPGYSRDSAFTGHQLESAVPKLQKITPFMWFDNQAEEAAKFYVGIFKNSRITAITHYGEVGKEIHGRPPGSVMTVAFELEGLNFTALNGGPAFQFTPAISFVISCDTQEEIDYYWNKLTEGGAPEAQQCGWLADKFGAAWQVVPRLLIELLTDENSARADRAMAAMLQMKKIDIATLKRAAGTVQ